MAEGQEQGAEKAPRRMAELTGLEPGTTTSPPCALARFDALLCGFQLGPEFSRTAGKRKETQIFCQKLSEMVTLTAAGRYGTQVALLLTVALLVFLALGKGRIP